MKAKRYTRYIKKEIYEKLVRDSRNRCCVSKCSSRTLLPGEVTSQLISKILHRHHLIFYSDGGAPTYENLILVCPNCHALIHSTDKYTVQSLKKDKKHWLEMIDVVPKVLRFGEDGKKSDMVTIPFALESLNLSYTLEVNKTITIYKLIIYISEKIITPLGRYDSKKEWINPDLVELALKSAPEQVLDPSYSLAKLEIPPGDSLIALVYSQTIAITELEPEVNFMHLRVEILDGSAPVIALAVVYIDPPKVAVNLSIEGPKGIRIQNIGMEGSHRRDRSRRVFDFEMPNEGIYTITARVVEHRLYKKLKLIVKMGMTDKGYLKATNINIVE